MTRRGALHVLLLLLWTGVKASEVSDVKVITVPGGFRIVCPESSELKAGDKNVSFPLKFKDENSMEYVCNSTTKDTRIFVKFRTCDNCVELDVATISSLAVGNLVATIVIGVAVYLVASTGQFGTNGSLKKGANRQRLVPKGDDIYEQPKPSQDTYDRPDRRRRP